MADFLLALAQIFDLVKHTTETALLKMAFPTLNISIAFLVNRKLP